MAESTEPAISVGERREGGAPAVPEGARHAGRALVIGIDDYPNLHAMPLNGCRSDAEWIAALLVERFGFAPSRVRTLLDREATRAGILAALDELRRSLCRDEPVVVHYSGHGSQSADGGGLLHETLVPHDSGRGEHANRDIADYEIHRWLLEVTRITGAVTLIVDSCHSGSIVRRHGAERRVEPDLRPHALAGPGPAAERAAARRGPSGWLPESDRYTLLAACRADESARELQDPESGRHHGAFTYHLARALVEGAGPCTTHREVFERAAARVALDSPAQHPQLEGAWDRDLFGDRHRVPAVHLPVRSRQGLEVRLGGGAVHGVVAGSEWAVVPAGSREIGDAEPCGKVRIARLETAGAIAELVDETAPGAVTAGARAFEVARPAPAFRFRADLAGGVTPEVEALAARLRGSPLVAAGVDPAGGDRHVTVYFLAPRSRAAAAAAPAPGLGALARPTWAVLDAAGRPCMPPIAADAPGAVERLVRNLEALARHRALFELRPPCPERDPLRPQLDVDLLPWVGGRRVEPESTPLELCEGDGLGVTVAHRHSEPLHVAILDLGLTGSVSLLYPARGAVEPLRPGHPLRLGETAERALRLSIPEELPYPGETEDRYWETLLLFASTSEADLGLLTQRGVRRPGAGPASASLAHTLRRALHGAAERSLPPAVEVAAPEPWTVVHRSFLVRRRR